MRAAFYAIVASSLLWAGCVSTGAHKEIVDELEQAKSAKAKTDADFEAYKAKSKTDIEALQQDNARLSTELITAQNATAKANQSYEAAAKELKAALDSKRGLETEAGRLRTDAEQAKRTSEELRRERDLLSTKADDLERQVTTAQQELANSQKAMEEANGRLAALEKEKQEVTVALTDMRSQARDLETRLTAEKAQTAALQEDKEKLIARTASVSDEMAKLQRETGEVHTAAAAERETSATQLAAATSEAERSKQQLATVSAELDRSKQQVASLTGELSAAKDDAAKAKQERDQLLQQSGKLTASIELTQEQLKAEQAERERVERERLAKEAELERLKRTQENLSKSLEAEIAKGDIKIKQVRDRLTINMVEQVLFDSGKAEVKPAGLKVLKQVSDVLKSVDDKQIRIEGHTDNVPIKGKLKQRFATNWELSTARATSVVRLLVDKGGVAPTNLSAVGYADTRPVASNDTPEGRSSNRRIEIVLYPKDLEEIAGELK